jgi:hypothetical protein
MSDGVGRSPSLVECLNILEVSNGELIKVLSRYPTVYKGKAVPQQTYGGAGGKAYSSYSLTTSALDAVSASRPGRTLPPGKWSPVPTR